MAQADWTELTSGIGSGSLVKGVSNGIARPPGGGSFIYGFSSLDTTIGAAGLFANAGSFAPMSLGGSVRGAVQRGGGGGNVGFAPLLYVCASTNDVTGTAYILGLSDADPHRIVLVKGVVSAGVPATAVQTPPVNGVLATSVQSFPIKTWLHLRLDAVVNQNGDVVLNCFHNDLTVPGASVTAPNWIAIPGIAQFVDDVLRVNTGSAPLSGGYGGFAFATSNVTRRGFFDQLEVIRQTS